MSVSLPQTLPDSLKTIRLKWLLSALESGRREISDTEEYISGALSIGGEHIGWQGQWKLSNPRFVPLDFYEKMSTGRIHQNDVLLVKDGATIGKVAIAEQLPASQSAVNEHVFLLRFSDANCPKFYFYFIQSSIAQDQIKLEVRGSAQPGLNSEFRNSVIAPNPPYEQQQTIADFLDRETTKIDVMIVAKERLLELLAEKRRALITHAVTHGLNPDVPLRDSGIPWLGQAPAHWDVIRLRWLFSSLEQGWSPQADDREPEDDEWAVLKLNSVNHGHFDITKVKTLPPELDVPHNLEVHQHDFLITRSNTPELVGDVCHVMASRPRLILCDLIYRLLLEENIIDGSFLNYFLLSPVGRIQIETDARGTSNSMVKISQEHIKDWQIVLPPLSEQRSIIAHINLETTKLDTLKKVAELTINLLKERRSALIAAAVTGRLEIPQ
ncbi:MAG: restriction endonuclease subunit S [Proteobacteria bacterium]|nr:restriction endonuclease subunit S [Pseudomonadota bacterium]